MSLRINIGGTNYWFIGDSLDQSGAISPLHHCDADGDPTLAAAIGDEDSYAYWYPDENNIVRYRQRIDGREDIHLGWKVD